MSPRKSPGRKKRRPPVTETKPTPKAKGPARRSDGLPVHPYLDALWKKQPSKPGVMHVSTDNLSVTLRNRRN